MNHPQRGAANFNEVWNRITERKNQDQPWQQWKQKGRSFCGGCIGSRSTSNLEGYFFKEKLPQIFHHNTPPTYPMKEHVVGGVKFCSVVSEYSLSGITFWLWHIICYLWSPGFVCQNQSYCVIVLFWDTLLFILAKRSTLGGSDAHLLLFGMMFIFILSHCILVSELLLLLSLLFCISAPPHIRISTNNQYWFLLRPINNGCTRQGVQSSCP